MTKEQFFLRRLPREMLAISSPFFLTERQFQLPLYRRKLPGATHKFQGVLHRKKQSFWSGVLTRERCLYRFVLSLNSQSKHLLAATPWRKHFLQGLLVF